MNHSARQLWLLSGVSVAMMALGLIWGIFDTRTYQDALVWIKPFKFALSLAVYFVTLALVVQRMSRDTRLLRATVGVVAAAFWFEMIYITLQAAQGLGSHYNTGDLYHGVMYGVMGVGAVSLVVGVAIIGVQVMRDTGARLSDHLRWGVGLGFILSTILTLITAATLSSMSGHFVGTPSAGAAVLPFFGWSASVGDLRPSHFVALHAMQSIPLLALWAEGRKSARAWVIGGAVIYTAVTMGLYVQALMGLPMIRL
jgi:hypothetical protein